MSHPVSPPAAQVRFPSTRALLTLFSSGLLLAGCDSPTGPQEDLRAAPETVLESRKPGGGGSTTPVGCSTGTHTQGSGAPYKICFPDPSAGDKAWNGDLIVYAHGYQETNDLPGEAQDIARFVIPQGYAFATTGYSASHLAVQPGINDVVDLSRNFTSYVQKAFGATVSKPADIILTGPSQGGLVTTLAVEQYPKATGVSRDRQVFSGGLAACGPYGSFKKQVDYLGHTLVIFNYFFPEVFEGKVTPVNVDPAVKANWGQPDAQGEYPVGTYARRVIDAVRDRPDEARYLRGAAGLPTRGNSTDAGSVAESVLSPLWYAVFASEDARAKLDGNPFGNVGFKYGNTGDSGIDARLDGGVARYTASQTALNNMSAGYETAGNLRVPFTTVHTSHDPLTPAWHQTDYGTKTGSGLFSRHRQYRHNKYGHCSFEDPDGQKLLRDAFSELIFRIKGITIIFQ